MLILSSALSVGLFGKLRGGAYYKLAVDGGREVDAQTTTALYADDYWFVRRPILVAPQTYIRLLLRVWIKVVDEWQISMDSVRGSNIYVRGYLDLRAWSLRLRA